jgi:hypothetical protein
VLAKGASDFFIGSYLKEILCYVGQQLVFEEASGMIHQLTGISVNAKQIERLCHHYGEKLEQQQQAQIEAAENPVHYSNDQSHYIMLDGGMLLTREEGWKELKLCRIFSAKEVAQVSKDRREILQSNYIGHLGTHKEFLAKVELHTDSIRHKIIVGDGAPWIWNWADALDADSIQILDFYHAKEHLCGFAELHFKEEQQRKQWINYQSLRLLNDQVEQVLVDLRTLKSCGTKARKAKNTLIKYYEHNSKRMKYRTFKENGWLIGSGAIEAAHRHVIQHRMKLSGQRWTIKGAQQVANLRMAYKSNQWFKVHEIINRAA